MEVERLLLLLLKILKNKPYKNVIDHGFLIQNFYTQQKSTFDTILL